MGQGFFDVHARLHQPTDRAASSAPTGEMLTVSQLTQQIDRAIRKGLAAQVLVKGEVSNYKAHGPSGNHYFTLKDNTACIDCAMFRNEATALRFRPEDGMELLATGRVSIYAQRGKYQLYVSSLSPIGQGALELALQQLRAKLENEGLFAPDRKRSLPQFPMHIALLTSRATAALQDMLKVFSSFPLLKVSLFHVPVQGDGSAEKIADAIRLVNDSRSRLGTELIILARGGGSLEDLWEFNEEVVARAIVASKIPVVTGIGHEVDTSIADQCADYFAHTPTEAAQVVVSQWRTASEVLEGFSLRMRRAVRAVVQDARQRLTLHERHEFIRRPFDLVGRVRQRIDDRQRGLSLAVSERLRAAERRLAVLNEQLQQHRPIELIGRRQQTLTRLQQSLGATLIRKLGVARERFTQANLLLRETHPRHRIVLLAMTMNAMRERLVRSGRLDIARHQQVVAAMAAQLNALNPEAVLQRGYSITTLKKSGRIVKSSVDLREGDRLVTRFAEGTTESVVQDQRQLPLFE